MTLILSPLIIRYISYLLDHFHNGCNQNFGFLQMNIVPGPLDDDQPSPGNQSGQLVVQVPVFFFISSIASALNSSAMALARPAAAKTTNGIGGRGPLFLSCSLVIFR